MGGTTLAESARHLLEQCLHVSARLESNDSGLIYMTFWKGAVRRQRKTDCLDCAFFPATTALFTVLLQKLASNTRHWASRDTTSSGTRIITDLSHDACSPRPLWRLSPVLAASV